MPPAVVESSPDPINGRDTLSLSFSRSAVAIGISVAAIWVVVGILTALAVLPLVVGILAALAVLPLAVGLDWATRRRRALTVTRAG